MTQNDWIGVIFVYLYVAILLIVTEKLLKNYPHISRKILHIMTGNIAFLLPLFQTREIMAFIAAGPFIIFTFLMSPYSPLKHMRGKTSEAGHGLGLVYYAISWTILAYAFFDQKEIIAIGILAMSYGDGLASVLGKKFGKKQYNIFGDKKSMIGSATMLFFTFIACIVGLIYYKIELTIAFISVIFIVALVATIVEALTARGLDNLSVPLITACSYWLFTTAV